ncbi:helix-turn-helix domain-containing protein [Paracidovorax avenae]
MPRASANWRRPSPCRPARWHATCAPPPALVQAVRLNRARLLIENSRMPVHQVAQEVGYIDATALRRLMRRGAGANPSAFRSGTGWR